MIPLAVEAREPFVGAEPEEASRVRQHAIDAVGGKAVGNRVGANRQRFGGCRSAQGGEKYRVTPDPFKFLAGFGSKF